MNTQAELDSFIKAGTALLSINVRPEWHDLIRQHLAVSLAHAQTVLACDLPDEADPAPVFAA